MQFVYAKVLIFTYFNFQTFSNKFLEILSTQMQEVFLLWKDQKRGIFRHLLFPADPPDWLLWWNRHRQGQYNGYSVKRGVKQPWKCTNHRNISCKMLSAPLCVQFRCETIFIGGSMPFWVFFVWQNWHSRRHEHLPVETRTCDAILPHICVTWWSFLPSTRIARYRNAASTDDTDGSRAQRSPGHISMVTAHFISKNIYFQWEIF